MRYVFTARDGYLKAALYERQTAAQTREFLDALAAEVLRTGHERVLISVHASRPIFRVEQYGASALLKQLAARPGYKVALLTNREELRAAHEYLEVLAGQRGAKLRSFDDEAAAVDWLRDKGDSHEAGTRMAAVGGSAHVRPDAGGGDGGDAPGGPAGPGR